MGISEAMWGVIEGRGQNSGYSGLRPADSPASCHNYDLKKVLKVQFHMGISDLLIQSLTPAPENSKLSNGKKPYGFIEFRAK